MPIQRIVSLSTVSLLLFAGAAMAVPYDSWNAELIHACVKITPPHKGRVRIVDEGANCRANEKPLDWEPRGPAGSSRASGPSRRNRTERTGGAERSAG
jgi:hypothetical protein